MTSLTWTSRKRKYESEKKTIRKPSQPCTQDPLKAFEVSDSKFQSVKDNTASSSAVVKSPLEVAFVDPLNQPLQLSPTAEAFSLSKIVADVSFKEKVCSLTQYYSV